LRLVVDREAEIRKFDPQEYWTLDTRLEGGNPPPFAARLDKVDGKKTRLADKDAAQAAEKEVRASKLILKGVQRKERKRNPAPPFLTSTLQREAFRKHRFSAKKTMMLAQRLYEGMDVEGEPVGLITYMRTDSTRISDDALASCRDYIQRTYGEELLPAKPVKYKIKKGAQDAHEAVRPTTMAYPPEKVKSFLEADQYKLYKLVWDRFLACQMKPAVFDSTVFEIEAGRYELRASGSILKFKGFMTLYVEGVDETPSEAGAESEEGKVLPELAEGEELKLLDLGTAQRFTQPPARFNESTLVKEMEDKGIGRPSTYAQTLSTIRDKGYVEMVERKFTPTDLGELVTELLVKNFPTILDPGFTSAMEDDLDNVEAGKRDWRELLAAFYGPFSKALEDAAENMENVRTREIETDVDCDKCEAKMVIKWGRNGYFLSCSAYPECKNAKGFKREEDGTITPTEGDKLGEPCPECQNDLIIKRGRRGRFIACSNYPDCRYTRPVGTGVACPGKDGAKCDGELVEKQSKTGRTFYACNQYPDCEYALWDRPITRECPECKNPFLVEKISKNDATIRCPIKECDYREDAS
jgi:DNA topoisomerase-1